MASSPVSSPSRKKQRLSSPTYEDEFDLLDGEDFRTLDEIEHNLSQKINPSPPFKEFSDCNTPRNASSLVPVKPIFDITRDEVLCTSPSRNLNIARMSPKFFSEPEAQQPSYLPYTRSQGSTSCHPNVPNQAADHRRPSSPEEHVEKDYDSWFLPSKEEQPVVFSSAFALLTKARETQEDELFTELSYQSDSFRESWTTPRPDTLEAARKKLQSWEHDNPDDVVASGTSDAIIPPQATLTDRKPFNDVQNSSASQVTANRAIPSELSPVSQQPRLMKPSRNGSLNPLLARTSAALSGSTSLDSSPATPGRLPAQLPSSFPASHKRRSLGLTPRSPFNSSLSRPKFKTPFKTGLAASNTGSETPPDYAKLPNNHSDAGNQPAQQVSTASAQPPLNDGPAKLCKQTDDSKSAISRPTLATCGLIPQTYDREELDVMGVPSTLFLLKDVSDFLYYRFNPIYPDVPTEGELNADTALKELQRTEHHLATKAWVDNHWCLILWKLSGMACLDPEKLAKIWCWKEVMRQLRYRYEKEFVAGCRSPLSLITARDTSITRPMVLCVSNISWPAQQGDPVLELTDGWYRIKAKTDKSIARATQRNIIRTGRKLVCICAKLETPRNEPMEILSSYGRAFLSLCGNSTHLAAWHAKLGFQKTRCIATLNSLSADGGRIPVMDLIVTDVYPIGYIEFVPSANGDVREGPRTESEEAIEEEKWRNKREREAMKLREELERKLARLEDYADSLERKAGAIFPPSDDDSTPNHLESIVDELVEGDNTVHILQNVIKEEAGWLCTLLRQRCLAEHEQAGILIERELDTLAPPRRVCNFKILRVKDARTLKRRPTRTAQLTVWDANALQHSSDGIEGDFRPGKRYLVTNLIPTQQTAWMGTEPGAEIFLSTGKNSKWQSVQ